MTAHPPRNASSANGSSELSDVWSRFWFLPTDGMPLAVIRIATAVLGLALWWSYAADLETWFGPDGMLPLSLVDVWRSSYAVSLFDSATTAASLWAIYAVTGLALLLLLLGLGTAVAAPVAAILWVSLLHRGPMLTGPADDGLAILLWCLVIGRCGDHLSLDELLRRRRGQLAASPSFRNRLALSLLGVHASLIALAAVLSQLKGDVWWDGTAAWWLVTARERPPTGLLAALASSEYLTNAVTHAITLFEVTFAVGVWWPTIRGWVVAASILAWPMIGWLAGDLAWGCSMAIMGLAWGVPRMRARTPEPPVAGRPAFAR
jgi:hypothetical protein